MIRAETIRDAMPIVPDLRAAFFLTFLFLLISHPLRCAQLRAARPWIQPHLLVRRHERMARHEAHAREVALPARATLLERHHLPGMRGEEPLHDPVRDALEG